MGTYYSFFEKLNEDYSSSFCYSLRAEKMENFGLDISHLQLVSLKSSWSITSHKSLKVSTLSGTNLPKNKSNLFCFSKSVKILLKYLFTAINAILCFTAFQFPST